jgi:hypothetical protein
VWLAWLTLLGFSLVGFLVSWFALGKTPGDVLESRFPILTQVLFGALTGWVCGMLAWLLISLPFMLPVHKKYEGVMSGMRLKRRDVWFISFCAGVGEEVLFRGGLQPLMGIWITSVVFVAIHGYLNPLNWRISVYGVLLTLVIVLLGWMAEYFGLITSMAAHMMIDVVLLAKLALPQQDSPHLNIPDLDATLGDGSGGDEI